MACKVLILICQNTALYCTLCSPVTTNSVIMNLPIEWSYVLFSSVPANYIIYNNFSNTYIMEMINQKNIALHYSICLFLCLTKLHEGVKRKEYILNNIDNKVLFMPKMCLRTLRCRGKRKRNYQYNARSKQCETYTLTFYV